MKLPCLHSLNWASGILDVNFRAEDACFQFKKGRQYHGHWIPPHLLHVRHPTSRVTRTQAKEVWRRPPPPPPHTEILKINSNAAFCAVDNQGAVRAILRDSESKFIESSAAWKSNLQSALIAEAEACKESLNLVREETNINVILETDSKLLVDLWKGENFDRSELVTILMEIREMSSLFSSFSMVFAKREPHLCA